MDLKRKRPFVVITCKDIRSRVWAKTIPKQILAIYTYVSRDRENVSIISRVIGRLRRCVGQIVYIIHFRIRNVDVSSAFAYGRQ
jgi:hypothetical protein